MHTLVIKDIRNTTWMVLSFVKEGLYCNCEDLSTARPRRRTAVSASRSPAANNKILGVHLRFELGSSGRRPATLPSAIYLSSFFIEKISFSKWEIRSQNCLCSTMFEIVCVKWAMLGSPWTKTGVKTVNLHKYLDLGLMLRLDNNCSTSWAKSVRVTLRESASGNVQCEYLDTSHARTV